MTHVANFTLKNDETAADPIDLVTKSLTDLTETVTSRMEALEEKAKNDNERFTKLETRLNRPGVITAKADDTDETERKAFGDYIRKGLLDTKTLNTTNGAAAGVLVPPNFEESLQRKIVEQSPFMAAATVTPVGTNSVSFPRELTLVTVSDGWVDEQEVSTETEPTFEKVELFVNELAKHVNVGNRMIEDGAFDIMAELEGQFATKFSQTLNQAFLAGNGVKKPVGLLTDTTIVKVNSGAAATFTLDTLIGLYYGMPQLFRANGSWIMNAVTLGAVRKMALASGVPGIFGENLAVGAPTTLLGRPIVEMVDMPNIAANATPIAFGSIADAYRIVNRKGLTFLRDPYSQASKRITTIYATLRIGGGVVRPEAIKLLKMSV